MVRRACASAAEAERLHRAVAVDDPGHVHVAVEGSTLVLRVDPAHAASVRATLDDLLRCLAAAERVGAQGDGAPHAGQ